MDLAIHLLFSGPWLHMSDGSWLTRQAKKKNSQVRSEFPLAIFKLVDSSPMLLAFFHDGICDTLQVGICLVQMCVIIANATGAGDKYVTSLLLFLRFSPWSTCSCFFVTQRTSKHSVLANCNTGSLTGPPVTSTHPSYCRPCITHATLMLPTPYPNPRACCRATYEFKKRSNVCVCVFHFDHCYCHYYHYHYHCYYYPDHYH